MDYSKLKDFAKKATEKTADGISTMNEMRKKLPKKQKSQSGQQRFEKQLTDNIMSVLFRHSGAVRVRKFSV